MQKKLLNPVSLAKPTGYTHGLLARGGSLLFLAGQTGAGPDGQIESPSDLVDQFRQALANVQVVVEAAGAQMSDIVKLTIFTTDKSAYLANLRSLGEAYRSYLGRYFPPITWVEVKSLFDDEALVEIEALAVIDDPD